MPRRPQVHHVQLTVRERDTLLAHVEPEGVLDDIFATARIAGPLVSLELGAHQSDEFFRCLEATAQSAQNESAMDRLDQVLRRLESGFDGSPRG